MFNVGDVVRIKEEFWKYRPHTPLGENNFMRQMQGMEYIVKAKNVGGKEHRYRLHAFSDYDWVWDENWLEDPNDIKEINICTEELDSILKDN